MTIANIVGLSDDRSQYHTYSQYIQSMAFTPTQLLALLGGFTVMLVQGSLYVYGTMTPYLLTYLHYQGETDLTVSQLSIINTIAIIMTNVGMFFSNFKVLTFSNRLVSLATVLGIALSTLILSFCKTFSLFIVLYGFAYGFFIGYGYLSPLKNTYAHLPNKKGLCSGTCLMGFGCGALIFNFILLGIVNPDNEKQTNNLFPKEVGDRLPTALLVLSAVYLGVGLLGVLLSIKPKDEDVVSGSAESRSNPLLELAEEGEEEEAVKQEKHYSLRAIKYAFNNKIGLLLAILTCCVPFGIFVAFHFKEYGGYFIKDDHYLSLLGSIGSIANGVFRMILGATLDLISFRKLMLGNILVFMVSCATIVFSVKVQATYFITVVCTYGVYGSLYSIFPTQNVRILGKYIGPKMYYITFGGFSLGALIQYVFHLTLVSEYGVDGYTYCFCIFGAFLVVGLVLLIKVDFVIHEAELMLMKRNRGKGKNTPEQETMYAQQDTILDVE